jgi:hypothetical protein
MWLNDKYWVEILSNYFKHSGQAEPIPKMSLDRLSDSGPKPKEVEIT